MYVLRITSANGALLSQERFADHYKREALEAFKLAKASLATMPARERVTLEHIITTTLESQIVSETRRA